MDIRMATDIAKKMVCQWGMSESLGPLNYGSREEHIYLGRDITRSEGHSEEVSREIDREIRRIVRDAEKRTRKILTEKIEDLKLLGNTLLEKETMAAEEVRALLGMPEKEAHSAETPVKPPAEPSNVATVDVVVVEPAVSSEPLVEPPAEPPAEVVDEHKA
jgi:cell division protease FtsH